MSIHTVKRSALLMHSALQMTDLVDHVESYPKFLPWCGSVSVSRIDVNHMIATIVIAYRGLHQAFTTRNTRDNCSSITMELVDGPFSHLLGKWQFHPLDDFACKVELQLDYAFSSNLLSRILAPIFHQIAATLVDAFVREAGRRYGIRNDEYHSSMGKPLR